MVSPSELRLGEQFIFVDLWNDGQNHGSEKSGAVFQLMPIIAQDVLPVVEVLAKFLEVATPLELLESANSSELDGIISASVFDVKESPHLQSITEFTSSERDAASIHALRKVIDNEGLEHGGEFPCIDAFHIVAAQSSFRDRDL